MCGIIGCVGDAAAVPILVDGLRRLEYRGYDSAGIAAVNVAGELEVRRAAGKLENLETVLAAKPLDGSFGVGHTRWATHGAPNEENAHPHRDSDGKIVVVHNGIIENYLPLRQRLAASGHKFVTETDTETIVHLVSEYFDGDLETAVRRAVNEFEGLYAIACIAVEDPQKIVAARQGPPLVVGLGESRQFVASDVTPILAHARQVIFLDDGEMAVVTPTQVRVTDFAGNAIEARPQVIAWDPVTAQKGGYRHFMLKEIHEQPVALRDSLVGRVERSRGTVEMPELTIGGRALDAAAAHRIAKLFIPACGTSWHAGLVGKFWIEGLAKVPVEVDYGSEFRYRDPLVPDGSVVLSITQSGETADTLAAMREAKSKGAALWTICNVVGSTATRLADGVINTHAGPEIGVASTKAFTTQLACLYQLALHLAQLRGTLSAAEIAERVEDLARLPSIVERTIQNDAAVAPLARSLANSADFLYLGRGMLYPIALEGALKLKEISYIHAEGYPAGEIKHGPIALIEPRLPVVGITPRGPWYRKMASNLQETRAREGFVAAIVSEGDERADGFADAVLEIPDCPPELAPIVTSVPLQQLAYHIAVQRGCDVDQPRNLAKSVTVE